MPRTPPHPTLAELDARQSDATAAEPSPDPRVVALQALVDAETARRSAGYRLEDARKADSKAESALVEARKRYTEAMRGTALQ